MLSTIMCELPNFLKYTKQCFKYSGIGHTQGSCENTLNCVRCGGNHHKKDCKNGFTDLQIQIQIYRYFLYLTLSNIYEQVLNLWLSMNLFESIILIT